jgi:putative ABC transport system permease protein
VLAATGAGKTLAVLSFEALNPFYVQSQQMFDTIFGFIFALIGGIVLFTVSNTMNAAVVERTVEVGTLRALGLRQAGIRACSSPRAAARLCRGRGWACCSPTPSPGLQCRRAVLDPAGSVRPLPLSIVLLGEHALVVGTTIGLIVIAVLSAWCRRGARPN